MKLTIEEKAQLLDGLDVWHTKPIGGLPSLMMADGPHGLRRQVESTDNLGAKGSLPATCFPTASLTACSFDKKLLSKMGSFMAQEAKALGVQVILGPGINMKRSPLCGRNFEYFSEDPHLTGELAAHFVRAIENQGVGTSVKHFFANNQERFRFTSDSIVDERALREIYLKAFERVIKENPATVMASYNKINGHYATEHPYLTQILRKEWNYYGVVVSDWGAIHHRVSSLKASTDLEMPSSMGYRTQEILMQSQDDSVRQAIHKSSERIVEMVKKYKAFEGETFDAMKHHEEAIRIARESMVLVKNQQVLPLNKNEKILIVGGFGEHIRYQGAGSSHINPTKIEQIKDVLHYYSDHITFCKGYTLDDKEDPSLVKEAINLAKNADKIIYLFGLPEQEEAEGFDRKHLNIPRKQVELLAKIHDVNKAIVGVALGGSVINVSFEHEYLKGLLIAYLGGQGAARAILDLLYGIENPSGRLAETWTDDVNMCNVQLTSDNNAIYYDESIFIGYRYYQTFNQQVRYPFGYGLSYTKFGYDNIIVNVIEDHIHIEMAITNTGSIKGKEVVQIYLQNNESNVFKARRELKAFDKVELIPGETKKISFDIPLETLKFYDIFKKRYILEKGMYQIVVGKDVCHEIESFDVEIPGEEVHHASLSYQKYTYDTSDFQKLIPFTLPPKQLIRKRPYTLSSTLDDTRHTLLGRVIGHVMVKQAMKEAKDMGPDLMEMAKKTVMETPMHMLSLFSAGKVSFTQIQGLVDMMNGHIVKGLKKIRQKDEVNQR